MFVFGQTVDTTVCICSGVAKEGDIDACPPSPLKDRYAFSICLQLLGASPPDPHRGSAPGPHWGASVPRVLSPLANFWLRPCVFGQILSAPISYSLKSCWHPYKSLQVSGSAYTVRPKLLPCTGKVHFIHCSHWLLCR